MRVSIIERDSRWELEKAVNEFLKQVSPSNIFDIKYCGEGNDPAYSILRYSVMIIMNS